MEQIKWAAFWDELQKIGAPLPQGVRNVLANRFTGRAATAVRHAPGRTFAAASKMPPIPAAAKHVRHIEGPLGIANVTPAPPVQELAQRALAGRNLRAAA